MINPKLKTKIDKIIRTFLSANINLQIDYKETYKLELVDYLESIILKKGFSKVYSKDLYVDGLFTNEVDKNNQLIIPKWLEEPSIVILYNIPYYLYHTINNLLLNKHVYFGKKIDSSKTKFILIDNCKYDVENIIKV